MTDRGVQGSLCMSYRRHWAYVLFVSLIALLPFGCAVNMADRCTKDHAIPNVTSTTKSELTFLPEPAQKVPVSVWQIPDETGQFRRSAGGGTELSHAVTHHMLIKALNDSGWFTVVERQGWPQLIQEIRIKEELRKRGATSVREDFAHLKVPQYMISGAITEFDDHPISFGGGFGLRGGSANGNLLELKLRFASKAIKTLLLGEGKKSSQVQEVDIKFPPLANMESIDYVNGKSQRHSPHDGACGL